MAVRLNAYAVTLGEWRAEVSGISAAVRDSSGEAVLAIGVSVATRQLLPGRIEALAPLVRETAGRLSRELGFSGDAPVPTGPVSAGAPARA